MVDSSRPGHNHPFDALYSTPCSNTPRAQHLAPIDCWSASRAIRCRSKVKTRIRRHCNLFLAFVAVLAFAFAAFATAGTALVFSNALVFCLRPRIQDSSQVNGGVHETRRYWSDHWRSHFTEIVCHDKGVLLLFSC
jgi:hypothetical protein